MPISFVKYLSGFVTPRRLELFDKVLAQRTRYLTVVLEDIYQSQNASAVLRSCDCFGIQDIHIIENQNIYTINPDVCLGSQKWLNLIKYNSKKNNTLAAFDNLRKRGYRIVATSPHQKSVKPDNFDISRGKVALVFGTELNGLTDTAIQQADECLHIPLHGFTESFNISISAAILLYHLTREIKKSEIHWELSKAENLELKEQWLKNSIKRADLLEQKFKSDNYKF